jgi:CO/xanthine dehydrogenase Mo-binding subunit
VTDSLHEEPMIGRPWPRPDAADKVAGRATYVDDLTFPGMLHAAVVRSAQPHGRLRSLDDRAARSDPAVVAVVSAADVPGTNTVHVIYDDQPVLAERLVRYIGEPVAVVVAEDRRAAMRAASRVVPEIDELPAVTDPEEALRDDAPAVAHPEVVDRAPNVFNEMHIRRGDTASAFADAAVIIEGNYATGYQEHAYLEPQGAIAVPDAQGSMALYGSMQCPFYVQTAVARALGLPLAAVRVVQCATGGAFGGKEDVPSHLCSLAAVAAWKTGRPVKLVLDRAEDILTTSKRHPARVRFRTAADRDGRLLALDATLLYDAGAYQTLSSAVLWRGLVTAAGPYRIPNVRVVATSVATNTVPCGAFRGFGSPQVILAHETQMDRLADRLGLDPVEIRRRNILHEGDETSTGQRLDASAGAAAALDKAADRAQWTERLADVATHNRGRPRVRRGIGVSTVMYGVGLGGKAPFLDKAGAYMKLEADGSVSIAVGTVEMGQGLIGALTQVASEALGVPPDAIRFTPVDSSRVPDSGPTVASRGTIMSALAILDAAAKLNDRMRHVAADLGIPPSEIPEHRERIAGGFWTSNLDPAVEGWAQGHPAISWDPARGQGHAYGTYAYATHIAEVRVDTATGEIMIDRLVAAHDSGTILNRQLASGQVEGGIAQGIGLAISEEIAQEGGRLIVNGLTTYRIPTIRDVAPVTEVEFVEARWDYGPHGAKGIGEVPLMASHTAVAAAVGHAVGQRVHRYPLSPSAVLELLRAAEPAAP